MIRFEVHVHPGSRISSAGGCYSGALVVRVRARAVDGAANSSVLQLLATAFDVPLASVQCLRGHRSRRKFFELQGDPTTLQLRLDALLAVV